MKRAGLLCIIAVLVALAANSYFLFTEATADGRTPVLTEKANSHFVVYFWPVSGLVGTESLFRDPCLIEHQDTTLPRIHLGYAVYGAIHALLDNPFLTHLVGNVLLMLLTIGIALLIGKTEFGNAWAGLVFGALLFFNWAPNNLVRFMTLGRELIVNGTLGQFVIPLSLTITRTLAIPVALLALFFFLAHVRKPTHTKSLLLGVMLALSLFTHFFLAVILFTAIGVSIVWLVWKKQTRMVAWIPAGVIALPALIVYGLFITFVSHQSFFADLAVDYVIFIGRTPMLPPLIPLLAMLMASACVLCSRRSHALKVFVIGLLIATFVGTNLQLVFGQNPQPNNWWQWTYALLIPLAGAVLVSDYCKRAVKCSIGLVLAGMILLLTLQGFMTYHAAGAASYSEPLLGEAIGWLHDHATSEQVVLAPLDVTHRVNLETRAKTYVCDPFQNTATFRENALRYAQTEWVYGASEDLIEERITNFSKASYVLHLGVPTKANIFGVLMSRTLPPYPDESYANIIEQRRAEVRALAASAEAHQVSFAVDYVLARQGASVQGCLAPVQVFANDAYVVYQVSLTACAREQPLIS
jgi:hypothetical protein